MRQKIRLSPMPTASSLSNYTEEVESEDWDIIALALASLTKNTAHRDKVKKTLTIECDGLCEPPHGGIGTWAFVVFDSQRHVVHQAFGDIGHGEGVTNNVAEYRAVIEALRWASGSAGDYSVEILTDSQLVVNQTNDEWACNAPHLQPLRDEAYELLYLTNSLLRWIPREKNKAADALTRRAYRQAVRKYKGGGDD